MLRKKLQGQESELTMQRQRFSESSKRRSMLKSWDWRLESLQRVLRRWWLFSATVWVILQVRTLGRMWKMRMMKRQSRATWAKMTNPAGWWTQLPKRHSSAWRGFGRSRWSLTNWHNRDGRMQPTTCLREISSMAHPNWAFGQLLNRKRMMWVRHLHPEHWDSLWSLLRLPLQYCKCHVGLLDQEVVILG